MRFFQYITKANGLLRLGVQEGQNIIDLASCDPSIPNNLLDFIRGGENMMKVANRAMTAKKGDVHKLEDVIVKAPIYGPDKVACVGMNYRDHCEELNAPIPQEPMFFNKFPSSIAGPNDPIPFPSPTDSLDYEVELALIIGKKGKDIPIETAMDHIFGYCVAHDVTARDWQLKKNGGQWLLGKTMEAFCPLGPCVVTRDEIPDPHSLPIRCYVNGILKQNGNTNKMVHKADAVVSFLSRFCTLLPGDVILTGTPPGVGCFRKPPEYLKEKLDHRALAMKNGDIYKMEDIIIKAPIIGPDKVACVGMNYRDHCEELNVSVPEEPVIFNKFPSSIAGPNEPIPLPSLTEALDYEVELAVIIGKKGKEIPLESAMDHVFGYCVAHDVTARDWVVQGKNGGQWLLGKTMDAFCPLGPCIVTRDEIPDPHSLSIRCSINGKLKQNGNTNKMVHRIDAVVSRMSRFCTLLPGDVILTGTPPGVGCFKKPPEYLKSVKLKE
ncbi:hypothetical protein J437_LFUL003034 [Ladona fulva]|uniref:Fumarylacetoacetase-like C-terminal domain-containing protein n=1 Tax=Ladona fulva TaxID=123851 RepID=A0A8K0JVR8_LADFU|nr:hypothetical protein J437_LFUL003034 [Ladona fulva]